MNAATGCVAFRTPPSVAFRATVNVAFRAPANVAFQTPVSVAFRTTVSVAFRTPASVAFRTPAAVAFRAPVAVAVHAPAAVAFRAAAADRALLGRVLAGSGVDRRPEPPDASYLRDLLARLLAALAELLDRAGSGLGLPPWLLAVVAGVLAAAAAVLLARSWWARRRRRAGRRPADPSAGGDEAAGGERWAAGDDRRDAAAWRLELERRLASGQVPEALRATWWWLARSLAGAGADPTWTGRELLSRYRREDLRELVRQLDGMTYGPRPPVAEQVRRLAASLQAALT